MAKWVAETCSRYFHTLTCICWFDISNYSIHDYGLLKIDCVLAFPFALTAGHGTFIVGSKKFSSQVCHV